MRRTVFGALLLMVAGAAVAQERPTPWRCGNDGMPRITCAGERCLVGAPQFVFAGVDADLTMYVCDGDRCWEGRGDRLGDGAGYISFAGAALKPSSGATEPVDALLSLDTRSGFGTVQLPGLATPVHCVEHPGE